MGKYRNNLRKLEAAKAAYELLPSTVNAKLAQLADVKAIRPLHFEDRQTHCNTHTTLLKEREYVTQQAIVGQHSGTVKFSRPVVLVSEHVVSEHGSLLLPEPYCATTTRKGKVK